MILDIPEGNFRAYFFDCDGTLADTMPLHFEAWQEALAPYSCEFPEDLFYEWGGKPTRRIVAELNELQGLAMDAAQVDEHREKLYLDRLHTVKPVPIVVDFLESLPKETPRVVVSGGPRISVSKTLDILGIRHHFPKLICSEDYLRGKPFPDCYLEASRFVNISPEHCLVFEDAQTGILAAEAAGMKWVKVPRKI